MCCNVYLINVLFEQHIYSSVGVQSPIWHWKCCEVGLSICCYHHSSNYIAFYSLPNVISVVSMFQRACVKWARCREPRWRPLSSSCLLIHYNLHCGSGERNSSIVAPFHRNCFQQRGRGCKLCHQNGTVAFNFSSCWQPPRSPFRYQFLPFTNNNILSVAWYKQ